MSITPPDGTLPGGIAKTLENGGFAVYTDAFPPKEAPCCIVRAEGFKEQRLPMGRLLREYTFAVEYRPRPAKAVIGFHDMEADDCQELTAAAPVLTRLLQCVETPEGPVRGYRAVCAEKNGALTVRISYPVVLTEARAGEPQEKMELTMLLGKD